MGAVRTATEVHDQVVALAREGVPFPEIVARLKLKKKQVSNHLYCARLKGELHGGLGKGNTEDSCRSARALRPIDFIPCTRCQLRGHTVENCNLGEVHLGLGQSEWAT